MPEDEEQVHRRQVHREEELEREDEGEEEEGEHEYEEEEEPPKKSRKPVGMSRPLSNIIIIRLFFF